MASAFTQGFINIVINPLFWIGILFLLILVAFLLLMIRRNRRFTLLALENTDLGQGHWGYDLSKAGFFGEKVYFKMLWWSGRKVLRLKTGEIVQDFSTEDYHRINGKLGVIVFRHPTIRNIVVPIGKIRLSDDPVYYDPKTKEGKTSLDLLNEIAPASYVDAAVDNYNSSKKETTDWKDKLVAFGIFAVLGIISLIIILVIVQYARGTNQEAAKLILDAGGQYAQSCGQIAKDICAEALAISKSGSIAP